MANLATRSRFRNQHNIQLCKNRSDQHVVIATVWRAFATSCWYFSWMEQSICGSLAKDMAAKKQFCVRLGCMQPARAIYQLFQSFQYT